MRIKFEIVPNYYVFSHYDNPIVLNNTILQAHLHDRIHIFWHPFIVFHILISALFECNAHYDTFK